MRRTRTTRRPRKSRRTFMPRGFVARLNAGDPAARYMKLQMMADPTRGASPNEVKIANKQMVKLEERHGKRALQEKVAAIKAEEDRAARARRGGGGGGGDWGEAPPWGDFWQDMWGAGGGTEDRREDWEEIAPQPNAPPGTGYHFRFNTDYVDPSDVPYEGILRGFVPIKMVREAQAYLPGFSVPAEVVTVILAEIFGFQEDSDFVAVWAAGEPEAGPTPGDKRMDGWEKRAEDFARELEKEDARRKDLPPRVRVELVAREEILGLGSDIYAPYNPHIGRRQLSPAGLRVLRQMVSLSPAEVYAISDQNMPRETGGSMMAPRFEDSIVAFNRAVRTVFTKGYDLAVRTWRGVNAAEAAQLKAEAARRMADPKYASLSRGGWGFEDYLGELLVWRQGDTFEKRHGRKPSYKAPPKTPPKAKAKPKAKPKAQPKASGTSRLDRFRQHPGWPDDIKVMKAYLAGAENPPR